MSDNLTLKYRPKTLDDVVGQKDVVKILKKQIETNTWKNVYLFCGAFGCVDKNTEFFNGFGWKKISEYSDGDKVLQYDIDTNKASLVLPDRFIKEKCDLMYGVTSNYGLDMCVSEEHTIIHTDSHNKNICKTDAKTFFNKFLSTKTPLRYKFLSTFDYSGEGISLSDNDIKLMCAVICDGSFRKGVNSNTCCLNLKKQRKINEARKILDESGIVYREKPQKNGYTRFYFKSPRKEKEFTSYWYGCNTNQLKLICDNIIKWDGTIDNSGRMSFYNANKNTIDFVQFAFSSCGKRASISIDNRAKCKNIYYRVTISNNNLVGMPNDKDKVKMVETEDGFKYCFTVPSHAWIMRRNGKILITGNCGKTTMARCMAYALNGVEDSAIEIDGAANNGVDNIRDIIAEANQVSLDYKYKIFIIDECQCLTNAAWSAALKIIEEPPKNCIFIFCTTDPQKLPKTILSRVQRFEFKTISFDDIVERLKYIADKEGISYHDDALYRLATLSDGHMRDAVKYFQQVAESSEVTLSAVEAIFGIVEQEALRKMFEALTSRNSDEALSILKNAKEHSVNLISFYDELTKFTMDCLVYVTTSNKELVSIIDVGKIKLSTREDLYNLMKQFVMCKKDVNIDSVEILLKMIIMSRVAK